MVQEPPPPWKVGWVAPALLLLAALFVQSAGLYLASQSYVRWMDELDQPLPHEPAEGKRTGSLQAALTLQDPVSQAFQGARTADMGSGTEFCVDFLTSLVSALWLGWVARTQNLRLWTKALLSGVVLATLKGFLAWATVLPDSAGWDGCRERLGEDGLMYYRSLAAGRAPGQNFGPLAVVQDIILLEIRGLWMMGRAGRQRICADTVFSCPTCFCVLFSVGLYDAVRGSTEKLEDTRKSTVRSLTGLLLGLVLLADLALTIASPHHYTLDVLVALVLTLLVYGNPATALAAELWVKVMEARSLASRSQASTSEASSAAGFLSVGAGLLRDLGQVAVPPCCIPFCSIGGLYYLRPQPGASVKHPWTEERARQHARQLEEFSQIRERDASRRRQVEEALDKEHAHALRREAEAAAEFERRLTAEKQRLAAAEEQVLAEARVRLEKERQAATDMEQKVVAELQRVSLVESSFAEQRARLVADADTAQREAEALRSRSEQLKATVEQSEQEAQALQELLASLQAGEAARKEGESKDKDPASDGAAAPAA